MCVVKKPKAVAVSTTEKDPAILRNPYLDGNEAIRASTSGLKSLRIERGTSGTAASPKPVAPYIPLNTPTTPTANPADLIKGPGGAIGMAVRIMKAKQSGALITRT